MIKKRKWQAILSHRRSDVLRLLESIRNYLGKVENLVYDEESESKVSRYALDRGQLGVALFLYHYSCMFDDSKAKEIVSKIIRKSQYVHFNDLSSTPALFSGFTGYCWLINHFKCNSSEFDNIDLSEIEMFLVNYVSEMLKPVQYDLMSGIVGIGVYALSRPVPNSDLILGIEKLLNEIKIVSGGHVTWKTHSRYIPKEIKFKYRNGYYNLGLAHGVPGVISFLLKCKRRNLLSESGEDLIRKSCDWLFSQRIYDKYYTWTYWTPNDTHESRLAWCYGDLGICATLYGKLLNCGYIGESELLLSISRTLTKLGDNVTGIVDDTFCHGTAGAAHLFNCIGQDSSDPIFTERSIYYYERILDKAADLNNYSSVKRRGDNIYRKLDPGLLNGLSGIGLSLISGISEEKIGWDEVFLM